MADHVKKHGDPIDLEDFHHFYNASYESEKNDQLMEQEKKRSRKWQERDNDVTKHDQKLLKHLSRF